MIRSLLTICILAGLITTTASAQRAAGTLPPVLSADSISVDVVQLSYDQPLIVIRFLGSLCSHCMQQLVALNERSADFKELHTKIIAFSNNPPSKCAEVTTNYRIDTSVIDICSDTDNACSRALGTTITEKDGSITDLHAFLILDRGQVMFEHYSATPLMGFASVMDVLRRLK